MHLGEIGFISFESHRQIVDQVHGGLGFLKHSKSRLQKWKKRAKQLGTQERFPVNLEDDPLMVNESLESFVKRLGAVYDDPLDSSAKSPESEWNTSLVNGPHVSCADVAISSRDHHALLFTARVDLAEDQVAMGNWYFEDDF